MFLARQVGRGLRPRNRHPTDWPTLNPGIPTSVPVQVESSAEGHKAWYRARGGVRTRSPPIQSLSGLSVSRWSATRTPRGQAHRHRGHRIHHGMTVDESPTWICPTPRRWAARRRSRPSRRGRPSSAPIPAAPLTSATFPLRSDFFFFVAVAERWAGPLPYGCQPSRLCCRGGSHLVSQAPSRRGRRRSSCRRDRR